jgi:hypothetical protein
VLVDEHESAAADVACGWMDDGEREADGDGCVDGVAAFFQNLDTGVGGKVVNGDDHGVRFADGLIVLELESDLAGVVSGGVLRRRRGLGGSERCSKKDGKSVDRDAAKGHFHEGRIPEGKMRRD